jgi:hypothetical protein
MRRNSIRIGGPADFLNINNVEIVSVQHEFGIYGGPAGSHLLAFLRDVQMPVSAHLFGRSHGQSIARCAHDALAALPCTRTG